MARRPRSAISVSDRLVLDPGTAPPHHRGVAFDGAGKPYRSGPSWGCALIVMVGAIVGIVLGLGLIFPLIFE